MLTQVECSRDVEEIGTGAFLECSSLKKIVLPAGVKTIGAYAFDDCDSPTIYAPKGSYAERYANENEISFKPVE